jgi:glycine dehydrogenase subunit 2
MEMTIFDLDHPGSSPDRLPVPPAGIPGIPSEHLRTRLPLPELPELDLVRHYERLSRLDRSPELVPQFTGSCTMKYSPRLAEMLVELEGLRDIHPYQSAETLQGALELMWQMQRNLSAITGLPGVSLQPAAGAQGMLAGMLMVKAYLHDQGQGGRNTVIIPDSAHGSNPATATMCGYAVRSVRSGPDGCLDLDHLRSMLNEQVVALMLTHPNTAGMYEREITTMARMVHEAGALLYLDGANMNALAGIVLPAALGVDVMQVNLHKTFATPHGGSGPGSGPVLCSAALEPYLPLPIVVREDTEGERQFALLTDRPRSIGRVRTYLGNCSVVVRAYVAMCLLGAGGIVHATEQAVLNANYLKSLLAEVVQLPLDGLCAHECVISAAQLASQGVSIEDVAKRLMDYEVHPPLYDFPKNLVQAMLIEPAETETKRDIDRFAHVLATVWREAADKPELVRTAPHTTPIGRIYDRSDRGGA